MFTPSTGDLFTLTGDLFTLAAEVEDNLQRQVLEQWFPRAADPAGGFHQNYAEDWSRLPGGERSVVYQSRLMWLSSQAARHFPAQSDFYLGQARHGLRCLAETLWDPQQGGFFWAAGESGEPKSTFTACRLPFMHWPRFLPPGRMRTRGHWHSRRIGGFKSTRMTR